MTQRNPNLAQLKKGYLFPEINKRKQQFLASHPGVKLISLSIGDTTQPIPHHITEALVNGAKRLETREGYMGYGPEGGFQELREKIASKLYKGRIDANDIFITDGAKCDLGRIQTLFGSEVSIAVQNPAYPVYLEGSLIHGVKTIVPMPCLPENRFFPQLDKTPPTGLIYFCSPCNPTGATATHEELKRLVAFAKKNRSIIIYDAAYAHYISDPNLPRSIFEIEEAADVAIEIGSFSKIAGFTGVRLGWTIIPKTLKYDDGSPVKEDWHRLMATLFNGASIISQWGGCSVLDDEGMKEFHVLTNYYLENARLLRKSLENTHCQVFGGEHVPYLWTRFPGKDSWEMFQLLLEQMHLVTTPGPGFGSEGEGFLRISAFGSREEIATAASRLADLH